MFNYEVIVDYSILESFDSYGIFALGSLNKPKYSLQAGVRFDVHQISMDDNFGLDQQYVDYSSRLSAYSPNIGFIYNLNKSLLLMIIPILISMIFYVLFYKQSSTSSKWY